jgi:hypothetical protein
LLLCYFIKYLASLNNSVDQDMLRRGVDELINVVMGPFVVVPNP